MRLAIFKYIHRYYASVSKQQTNNEDVVTIALEIRNYLSAHPNAVDSLEGITKWWLTRQRYEEAVSQVQKALDSLVAESVISKRVVADGRVIYANVATEINEKDKSS